MQCGGLPPGGSQQLKEKSKLAQNHDHKTDIYHLNQKRPSIRNTEHVFLTAERKTETFREKSEQQQRRHVEILSAAAELRQLRRHNRTESPILLEESIHI